MQINGIVVSGMGEGQYFMSMPHYKNEIKRALGFFAYPGTLNIQTSENWKKKLYNPIQINGMERDGKMLGSAECYIASIRNINGAVIVPKLTKHKDDIVEFIAPIHLRSELKLKNGEKITIDLR